MENKIWCLCSNDDKVEIVNDYRKNINTLSFGGEWTFVSAPSDTKEQLLEDYGIDEANPCTICNSIYPTKGWGKADPGGLCFSCGFWDKYSKRDGQIIFGGSGYRDSGRKDGNDRTWLGFGGHEWKIRMNDGTLVETNNLWHSGEVPKAWLERLPDNAVVLQPIKRKSQLSGIERTMYLPVTREQMQLYADGGYIQEVFSHLTPQEREFILSGISAEEWDETFKED